MFEEINYLTSRCNLAQPRERSGTLLRMNENKNPSKIPNSVRRKYVLPMAELEITDEVETRLLVDESMDQDNPPEDPIPAPIEPPVTPTPNNQTPPLPPTASKDGKKSNDDKKAQSTKSKKVNSTPAAKTPPSEALPIKEMAKLNLKVAPGKPKAAPAGPSIVAKKVPPKKAIKIGKVSPRTVELKDGSLSITSPLDPKPPAKPPCFNCQQPDHHRRFCPRPTSMCGGCKEPGHIRDYCGFISAHLPMDMLRVFGPLGPNCKQQIDRAEHRLRVESLDRRPKPPPSMQQPLWPQQQPMMMMPQPFQQPMFYMPQPFMMPMMMMPQTQQQQFYRY